MSYTTKILAINKDTFEETLLNSIAQDNLIKWMDRPNAQDPKYLLLLKDNRIIIIDKNGNIVLDKIVDYTINQGSINNNGMVAVKSGAELYVYDVEGNLVYHETYGSNIAGSPLIGTNYLWVKLEGGTQTVYIYDLSDFTYKTFQKGTAYNSLTLAINETGEIAFGGYWTLGPVGYLFKAFSDGSVVDASTTFGYAIYNIHTNPLGAGGLLRLSKGGPQYAYVLFNSNLETATLKTGTETEDIDLVHDINLSVALFFNKASANVDRWSLNIETLTGEHTGTLTLPHALDEISRYKRMGDMTPDGKFAVIPSTEIFLIDVENLIVAKTINKAFSNVPVRMIVS